jgi:hypothetical protein
VLDDHDMVARDGKHRFSARNEIAQRQPQAAHAVGAQLTTLGIPCIYYGTEQAFDGTEGRHDASIEPLAPVGQVPSADRYIREAMFGGEFGAFETGCHFLDPAHPTYLRIARLRNRDDQIGRALRRGRQYWRDRARVGRSVSFLRSRRARRLVAPALESGSPHRAQHARNSTAKRIRHHRCRFSSPGETLTFLYRGDWSEAELRTPPAQTVIVEATADRRSVVRVDLPAAGMAILA